MIIVIVIVMESIRPAGRPAGPPDGLAARAARWRPGRWTSSRQSMNVYIYIYIHKLIT